MKVRISMPGAYTAVELEEERAYRTFRKLNEILMCFQTRTPATESKAGEHGET